MIGFRSDFFVASAFHSEWKKSLEHVRRGVSVSLDYKQRGWCLLLVSVETPVDDVDGVLGQLRGEASVGKQPYPGRPIRALYLAYLWPWPVHTDVLRTPISFKKLQIQS